MKILFVYKTEPDNVTKVLASKIAQGNEVVEFHLYKEKDYEKLLDLIFECDKTISWW